MLEEYKKKRKFDNTTEPEGMVQKGKGKLKFIIQKHHASHLHYDFRIELEGVLKSWAIPKGPSLNPVDKRLAMMVEDHPMEYGKFEGIIPKGNYGAGTVMLWDEGTYHYPGLDPSDRDENEKKLLAGLHKGNLKLNLNGSKLNGEFALVRTSRPNGKGNEWLLIKKNDDYSTSDDILKQDRSVSTGRTMEEIKDNSVSEKAEWHSGKTVPVKDGKISEMPHLVSPMKATLTDNAFNDKGWVFEIKWDGYRAIAQINYNKAELYSRNLLSFNHQFELVADQLRTLGLKAILDGEIVVLDDKGRADFSLIQNYHRTKSGKLVYYVYDILYYDKYDLTDLSLLRRKEILKTILPQNDVIRYNDHVHEVGELFYAKAAEEGIEGIIAKKADSRYIAGVRSRNWLKIKIQKQQEAVIVGFTEPKGSRKYFGSLVLGAYEEGRLKFIGNSGGGFNDKDLAGLYQMLTELETDVCPLADAPKSTSKVRWVKPALVCEVRFQEWTKEGIFRQPVYLGLRVDKDPSEVIAERNIGVPIQPKEIPPIRKPIGKSAKTQKKKKEKIIARFEPTVTLDFEQDKFNTLIEGKTIQFTNLSKVFWPESGITKGDVIEYYDKISSFILPYLIDRPQSLRRTPHGVNSSGFFQKNMPSSIPEWIDTVKIPSESAGREINYMLCQNKATLLYMANLGCIELNPWSSRIQNQSNPDFTVIDLDPVDVDFNVVIEVAQAVHEILKLGGISGYPKTSGSKGIHIYIPLGAKYNYDQARDFAFLISSLAHQLVPEITSLERMPSKRKEKVYLDYLQNGEGKTLASPYCLRPKPGAKVSTPLEWNEVKPGLKQEEFNIESIFDRIKIKGDLFLPVLNEGIDMDEALNKLVKR
ncbi:MAG: DNA ligase D [Cytophagaceae bacterium]